VIEARSKAVGKAWWIGALLIVVMLLGIVLSRPYDGAQFHSARSGVEWTHHAQRVQLASELPALHPLRAIEWFLLADQDFPPLVPAVGALLGFVVGHDEEPIHRAGVLWLLLLALATALLTRALHTDPRVAVAAGVCCLLLPAHHAASLGFYFDLPMVALLWMGLAVLAWQQNHRPVRAGLAAGFVFTLAALAKWTALPLIPPLALGVLLIRPEQSRWDRKLLALRVRAALPLLALSSVLVLSFWRLSSRSWNRMLAMSFGGELDPSTAFAPTSWLHALSANLGGLGTVVTTGRHLTVEALYWYSLHFIWAYLSVPLTILLAVALLGWMRRPDRSWPLIASATATHLVLLFGIFTSLDERFLLSLGPALVLPPILGWYALPTRPKALLGGFFVGCALWVALDFHHSSPSPGEAIGDTRTETTNTAQRIWDEINVERRGLGLQSATDRQWGWMRSDALRPAYFEAREVVWSSLRECGADVILAQEELTLDGFGEGFWWDYRRRLAVLRSESVPASILGAGNDDSLVLLSGASISVEQAARSDSIAAITRYEGSPGWHELPLPQPELGQPKWDLRAVLDRRKLFPRGPVLMDGPELLALWTPFGSSLCPQWPATSTAEALP